MLNAARTVILPAPQLQKSRDILDCGGRCRASGRRHRFGCNAPAKFNSGLGLIAQFRGGILYRL